MTALGEVRLGSREAAERQDRGDPARRRNRSSEPTWPEAATPFAELSRQRVRVRSSRCGNFTWVWG